MMVVYQDNHFKSVLNEFKPPLTEKQLNLLLNQIPDDHTQLEALVAANLGQRVKVERVKAIGEVPALTDNEYPVNEKIALFCELFEKSQGIKYKTCAADIGKLKALTLPADELRFVLEVYFSSNEWYLTPKSIANFIKKFNEVRVLAYGKPKPKTFPLPYNHEHFVKLGLNDKRDYQNYLRANGYVFQHNSVRGGTWILQTNTLTQ